MGSSRFLCCPEDHPFYELPFKCYAVVRGRVPSYICRCACTHHVIIYCWTAVVVARLLDCCCCCCSAAGLLLLLLLFLLLLRLLLLLQCWTTFAHCCLLCCGRQTYDKANPVVGRSLSSMAACTCCTSCELAGRSDKSSYLLVCTASFPDAPQECMAQAPGPT